jgi:rhodanese-related sulfurtransferase
VLVLQQAGITNAKALRGGFRAWMDRGYPTASGEK